MPIRSEFRHFYRGPVWAAVRASILDRAEFRCERCGKPNHRLVWVTRDGTGRWFGNAPAAWSAARAGVLPLYRIRVVITIAHLNHDPADNRPENLQALCQRCHLAHDVKHHYATARRTRAARCGQLWLF